MAFPRARIDQPSHPAAGVPPGRACRRRSLRIPGAAVLLAGLVVPAFARAQGEIHVFTGLPGDALGWSVARLADLDQDGVAEWAVGSRHADVTGQSSGAIAVHSGATGIALATLPGNPGEELGVSVSDAGDVDQDGTPDIIAGATGGAGGAGVARVYSGATFGVLHTFTGLLPGDSFGFSVGDAGDTNNDGFPDLVVGALFAKTNGFESGQTRVFSGFDGSLLFFADGSAAGYWEGQAVDGAGDVDGDGFADVLSSAPHANHLSIPMVGRVQILSGQTGQTIRLVYGSDPSETLGIAAAFAGDADGDGVPDFIAGSPTFSPGPNLSEAGRVRVFSGKDTSVLLAADGAGMNAHLGASVGFAGDVDGDGIADVLAGAPDDKSVPFLAGSVRVYSVAKGSEIGALPGDPFLSDFGHSVAGGADANADGVPDILAGAPFSDAGGGGSGQARLVSGACLSVRQYGAGSAGSGGIVPTLGTGGGLPALGNTSFLIEIENALGGAPAGLVLGAGSGSLATAWGEFLIDPALPFVVVPLLLNGTPGTPGGGSLSLQAPIPFLPGLAGAKVYSQALIGDPGSTGGIAATQGLEIGFCE